MLIVSFVNVGVLRACRLLSVKLSFKTEINCTTNSQAYARVRNQCAVKKVNCYYNFDTYTIIEILPLSEGPNRCHPSQSKSYFVQRARLLIKLQVQIRHLISHFELINGSKPKNELQQVLETNKQHTVDRIIHRWFGRTQFERIRGCKDLQICE